MGVDLGSASSNLRILDGLSASKELDLVSELFHQLNKIIPPDQKVLTFAPDSTARVGVQLLKKHGYSQAPVIAGNEVLGVFSHRSFAQKAASLSQKEWSQLSCAPGDLPVIECIEPFEFARLREEMSRTFNAMERDNGILVGTPEQLLGILTPMDVLRYLHRVASPFVMVSEIERALRRLMRIALTQKELEVVARLSLAEAYKGRGSVPTVLEDMSFDNYRMLVTNAQAWRGLEPVLGGTKNWMGARLKEIGQIRNDLFHFRRELTDQDHEALAGHRAWFLSKVRQAELALKAGAPQ